MFFRGSKAAPSSVSKTTARREVAMEPLENRQMCSATPHITRITPTHSEAVTLTVSHAHAAQGQAQSKMTSLRKGFANASMMGRGAKPLAAANSGGTTEPYVTVSGLHLADYSGQPLFSSSGPTMDDINQGQVGDCYFLSALAEEASKNPGWIRQLVRSRGDGTFDVWLYHNGWVDERVDGYLPVNQQGQLVYAGLGQGGSTWVAIMEKGFCYFRAALRGQAASYSSIDTGTCAEALTDLGLHVAGDFGASSFGTGYNLAMYVFNQLNAGYDIELMTNAATGPMVKTHAYAVVQVGKDSAGTLYLEVRNPWGRAASNGQPYQWVTASQVFTELADVVLANP